MGKGEEKRKQNQVWEGTGENIEGQEIEISSSRHGELRATNRKFKMSWKREAPRTQWG